MIDKSKRTQLALDDLQTVLILGLPFISRSNSTGSLVLDSFSKAPSVPAASWKNATQDSRLLVVDDIMALVNNGSSELYTFTRSGIDAILAAVMGLDQIDVSAFLAFADRGDFSGKANYPLNNLPDPKVEKEPHLTLALTTLVVSTALAQNGWHILAIPGVDPLGLANRNTPCPEWALEECQKDADLGCSGYNEYNQCNDARWWYSASHNTTYTLVNKNQTDPTEIINAIFPNLTTGPLLFENAAICELQSVMDRHAQRAREQGLAVPSGPNYTSVNGTAGFAFYGDLPEASNYTSFPNTTNFIPLQGFVSVAKDEMVKQWFYHPVNTIYSITSTGFDLRRISQLNTTIATKWKDGWS